MAWANTQAAGPESRRFLGDRASEPRIQGLQHLQSRENVGKPQEDRSIRMAYRPWRSFFVQIGATTALSVYTVRIPTRCWLVGTQLLAYVTTTAVGDSASGYITTVQPVAFGDFGTGYNVLHQIIAIVEVASAVGLSLSSVNSYIPQRLLLPAGGQLYVSIVASGTGAVSSVLQFEDF